MDIQTNTSGHSTLRYFHYYIVVDCRAQWKYHGSSDKHRGLLITTSLEGCTHRLADVGNRVHTRNDSDEDVRGNACKKAIAWKALPWSFHYACI